MTERGTEQAGERNEWIDRQSSLQRLLHKIYKMQYNLKKQKTEKKGSMCVMVGLPGEVLDDHGVGPFVAEAGSGLHEV